MFKSHFLDFIQFLEDCDLSGLLKLSKMILKKREIASSNRNSGGCTCIILASWASVHLIELNNSFSRSCSHIHILIEFMVFASLSLHTEHGTIAKQYANRVICQFVSYVVGCQKFVHVIVSTNFPCYESSFMQI